MTGETAQCDAPPEAGDLAANGIRLSPRDWLIAAAIVVVTLSVLPSIWRAAEPFDPDADYRIPFALSNDYWMDHRLIADAAARDRVPIIGDSVVWGEFVPPDQTLSAALNAIDADSPRFVNAGVNGAHPLALWGLVDHYAGALHDRRVMLELNLLWLASPQRDLSDDSGKDVPFNHPALIPQFYPNVPVYRASASDRIAALIDNRLPTRWWVNHLRAASFDGLDLHSWTIEHPYDNPLAAVHLTPPPPTTEAHQADATRSWQQRGIEVQQIDWIELDRSLQWLAFQRTVELLERRGNRVFVLITPLNGHMLTDGSRSTLAERTRAAGQWLGDRGTPFTSPEPLASDQYADASHPLFAGYEALARRIREDDAFRDWLGDAR